MKNFEFTKFFVTIFVAIFAATGILTLNSCQEDEQAQARVAMMADTTEVFLGYAHESSLTHRLDTVRRTVVSDEMEALLKVWQTEDGERSHLMYNNTANPVFNAKSLLRYEEYSITEDQLNPKVIATWLARSSKDNMEIDTLYVDFADGQRDSIPMDITSFETEVGGHPYYHGTVTVVDAKFVSLTNYPIETRATRAGVRRAPYVAKSVNTEYKALVTLKEKNVHGDGISPKTFDVPVYAYAIRHIMKDDAISKITVENKNRVVLTDSTERCSFDKVTTFESGDVTRESIQIELKREFKGIDTYEKTVSNFDFSFNRSKGIAKGTDAAVREDGKWLVSGRTDRYAATITNGVAADMITTDYSLYHERAVYTDGDFVVEFGYEDVRCNELETTVNKIESNEAGKSKALEHNKIQTVYIGHPQDLAEDVILVMTSKLVTGYEIANPLLKVYNDSVVATLDFITKFSDGTKDTEHERFSAPRSLVCTTDWSSTQIAATQTTDETIAITTTSSNDKKQGYWKFTEQTRRLDNYAHLSDDSKQHNSWTAIVPNSISYTREGKTHDFGVLAFAATHVKATLVSTGKTSGGESYKYTEEIKVRYQDNNQNITAPGKLLVNGSEIRGYEIRDKKLVVDNDKVTASLTFVTVFMNGTEDKDPVSKTFPRSLKLNTNWTAIETATANQTTGQPTVTKTGSQSKTDNEWKWNEETRSITTVATLASSKQNNNWTSVDPNNIVFTRNGQMVDFGTLSFNAVYVNATTVLKNKTGLVETYDYANTISVNFGDNMQTTTAPGTIRIERAKEVTGHEIRDAKMVISDNDVTCSLTFVTLWNDGTETTEAVNKSFPRTLNPYTNWTANANNGNEQTGAAAIEDFVKKNMTEGNWSYVREERDIITKVTLSGSTKENGWTSVEPNSIVYTREGKTHAFGEINFNAKEDGHSAVLGNSSATLDVYNYTDKLTVTFGSNTKSSTAPGTINVKKEIVPVGYEIVNQKLDVQQNGVTASLDFVTKFSDGTSTSEKMQKFFARRFEVITNWNSVETSNSQSTGAATVTLNNSENKKDGDWSYVNETRSISTTATLAGSTQKNGWQSVDPNAITFTKNGKTYSFQTLSFNASETGANVSKTSEDDDKTVYSYKDNISVMFGGNQFASSAPGKITVNKPWDSDFPKEWGKFVACKFTVAPDENRKTWVYTWSMHFEHGTLPVVVRKSASEAEINQSYFTSETDSRLNGGYYLKSKKAWVNTIADNGTDWMEWLNTANQNQGNMAYSTATAWGWDNGAQTGGHPSVFTNRFTAKITNGGLVLTIYKEGKEFASYKAGK